MQDEQRFESVLGKFANPRTGLLGPLQPVGLSLVAYRFVMFNPSLVKTVNEACMINIELPI